MIRSRYAFAGLALAVLSLVGCTTPPTEAQAGLSDVTVQIVAGVAVRETVTRGNASPEKMAERAAKIVTIATALKAMDGDSLSTLPAITAALTPLLDRAGLDPLERYDADLLVQALITATLQRVEAPRTFATLNLVLSAVIRSASFYLPLPPHPSG